MAPSTPDAPDSTLSQQRPAAAVSGLQQDREVADLLRNLVRGDGNRGRDAQRHGREHGAGDDRAVDEIVERVADQHERRGAVRLAVVGVAMTPQDELLEHEERENAAEQRHAARRARAAGERLRQQPEQRNAEQRADGIADEPRNDRRARAIGKQQERRGGEQAPEAAEEAQCDGDDEPGHEGIRIFSGSAFRAECAMSPVTESPRTRAARGRWAPRCRTSTRMRASGRPWRCCAGYPR